MESRGSSQIKCSAQQYNQYCFDWVVHFNKWLEEPQTNPSLVLNAFHLFYAAAEIAVQPQDFILTVLAVREVLPLPKEQARPFGIWKEGVGKGGGELTGSEGVDSC